MLHVWKQSRRRMVRSRQFSPTDPLPERGTQLEARALTAPALWYTPGPGQTANATSAGALFGQAQPGVTVLIDTSDTVGNPTTAGSSTSATYSVQAQPIFGFGAGGPFWTPGGITTVTGLSSSIIYDDPNTGVGLNVGNPGVSMIATEMLNWSADPGAPPVLFADVALGARAYVLADTLPVPPTSATYLVESYSLAYSPPSPGGGGTVFGAGRLATTTGLGFTAVFAGNGLGVVAIASSSGPVTVGLGGGGPPSSVSLTVTSPTTGLMVTSLTVNESPTSLSVVSVTFLGALPPTTPTGPVTGPAYGVAYGTTLTVTVPTSPTAISGTAAVTSSFNVSFA